MSATQRPLSRRSLTTHGTGHPRLHLVHSGHLYAGATQLGVFALRGATTIIGSGSDVHLLVPGLEARHAEILRTQHDEFQIRALSGTVSVNGVVRPVTPLHSGDLIRCGSWAASFGRDESTDHVPLRSQSYPPGPQGLLARWNRLVFLVYGSSSRAPEHRNAPRRPGPAPSSSDRPDDNREDTP